MKQLRVLKMGKKKIVIIPKDSEIIPGDLVLVKKVLQETKEVLNGPTTTNATN
jgi:hypothetical protein